MDEIWVFTPHEYVMMVELTEDGLTLDEIIEYFPTAIYFYAHLVVDE